MKVEPPFDIFKMAGTGEARWIEAVSTLAEARKLVSQLMADCESEYLIFNQSTGEKISIKPQGETQFLPEQSRIAN